MLTDLIKGNDFTLKKLRSRRYPTEILTEADHADCIALLANTPIQVKSMVYSQAAGGTGFHVNFLKNGVHMFQLRRSHLHAKRQSSETG